jgi:hypothetical protein
VLVDDQLYPIDQEATGVSTVIWKESVYIAGPGVVCVVADTSDDVALLPPIANALATPIDTATSA